VILLEFVKLFLLYFFIEIKVNWCCMIKYKIILLFFILILRIRITHDIDVSTTVINMHDVIDDFHILWIIRWVPFIILVSLTILYHIMILFISLGLSTILRCSCWITFICIIICLISFHINFVAQLLWIFSYSFCLIYLIIILHVLTLSNKTTTCEFQTVFNRWLSHHVQWIHT